MEEVLEELKKAIRKESPYMSSGATLNVKNKEWNDALYFAIKKLESSKTHTDKVVIPQFVADLIEYYKGQGDSLGELLAHIEYDDVFKINLEMLRKVVEWVYPDDFSDSEDRIDLIARAWLDGYEVEKEKLYIIKFAPSIYGTPTYGSIGVQNGKKIMQSVYGSQEGIIPNQYTRREIEEVDSKYMIFAEEVTE